MGSSVFWKSSCPRTVICTRQGYRWTSRGVEYRRFSNLNVSRGGRLLPYTGPYRHWGDHQAGRPCLQGGPGGLIFDGSGGSRSRVNLEAYILGTSSAFRLGAREQGSSLARPIVLNRCPSHVLLPSPTSQRHLGLIAGDSSGYGARCMGVFTRTALHVWVDVRIHIR